MVSVDAQDAFPPVMVDGLSSALTGINATSAGLRVFFPAFF
jgi:hypothetical protein